MNTTSDNASSFTAKTTASTQKPAPSSLQNIASKIGKFLVAALVAVLVVLGMICVFTGICHDVAAWSHGQFALSAGTIILVISLFRSK